MKKISISAQGDFPDQPSSFALIFVPIVDDLAVYFWDDVFIEIPFDASKEVTDEYLSIHSRVSSLSFIPPDTYLPRLADFVFDGDWHSFHGFLNVKNPDVFFNRPNPEENSRADLFFQCVDGGPCWVLGSNRDTLIAAVVDHCARMESIHVTELAD